VSTPDSPTPFSSPVQQLRPQMRQQFEACAAHGRAGGHIFIH
jgi:hypothetical protein